VEREKRIARAQRKLFARLARAREIVALHDPV
jgi:hypothetical protein